VTALLLAGPKVMNQYREIQKITFLSRIALIGEKAQGNGEMIFI
jgi:hypothetical protein